MVVGTITIFESSDVIVYNVYNDLVAGLFELLKMFSQLLKQNLCNPSLKLKKNIVLFCYTFESLFFEKRYAVLREKA